MGSNISFNGFNPNNPRFHLTKDIKHEDFLEAQKQGYVLGSNINSDSVVQNKSDKENLDVFTPQQGNTFNEVARTLPAGKREQTIKEFFDIFADALPHIKDVLERINTKHTIANQRVQSEDASAYPMPRNPFA